MPSFLQLIPFLRPRRPEHGPVPQLLPEWRGRRQRRLGPGTYLRRLGGAYVLTAWGSLPRLRGIEAVRGYCLARLPLREVELLIDGSVVRRAAAEAIGATLPFGLRKYVFNLWHDFGGVAPGVHRIVVRPVGPAGRLRARRRKVVVESHPDQAPDSDAYIPREPGDERSPEEIVAALPTGARAARRSVLPGSIRSILVIRADQLGDLVVSVPALLRLRQLFPEARITALVTAANVDLANALDLFDERIVVAFAGGGRTVAVSEQERLATLLAGQHFDVAVDLGEGAQSRLMLMLSGAAFRYGFRHGDHAWLSASFEFNARDPANGMEVMPPSAKLLALVEALGALRPTQPVKLPRPEADLAAYGLAPGERFIVLHTGARLACSRWPGFGRLAELLLARTPHALVIFTHGEPWEAPAGTTAHQARVRVIDGQLPFADFDGLLGACAVFIGNDSGPKHLAALRGVKVVSLHMARLNWNEWGQEGEGLILSRRVPCAGCNIGDQPDECGRDYTCLRSIAPEEVCEAVLRLL